MKRKIKKSGTSERRRLTGVLDELSRRLCKIRDHGKCRRCSKLGLHAHHVFSRRHSSIRFTLNNLISLCPMCHGFAHSNPDYFRSWVISEIGPDNYAEIEQARNYRELTLEELDSLIEEFHMKLRDLHECIRAIYNAGYNDAIFGRSPDPHLPEIEDSQIAPDLPEPLNPYTGGALTPLR